MKTEKLYLGIDTSNYTTSLALCDDGGKVVANIKKLLDVKEGERGLRQSDAVFAHIKNLSELSPILAAETDGKEICAVGVSVKPRDIEGSYMPCFLAGKAVADTVASSLSAPISYFSHQAGHIMAALYSSERMPELLATDFIAFHVSGGTTELLYVHPNGCTFDIDILGGTADISAGQAIDRAGVMMGLKFPCGKEIEQLALANTHSFTRSPVSVKNMTCNLSGLENKALKLFDETSDMCLVSAYVMDFISRTLVKITEQVREKYPNLPILYAGGVMSNRMLKGTLEQFENTYFATPEFSSDNAAGIALLAHRRSKE